MKSGRLQVKPYRRARIMNKGQVITIQGSECEWYQKAVFVMKEDLINPPVHKDLKEEAERIIGNYAKRSGLSLSKKTGNLDTTLNLILWGSICVLAMSFCLL